ncbi:ABC transporter substrate-binding protein [Deinococcus sp.]|uniref:ABC transporter substrate-binding protein n=1 Tax=Deinococcus sp. TaxID=47478 RepID=UPI003C7D3938
MKHLSTLLALTTLSLAASAAADKTVTVGWSGAITGPTSDAGINYGAGVEDYCKYAAATNMVPGYKLNCIARDDQYVNANTQRNFEDYVGPVFLGYSTGATLQLKATIQETKTPSIMGTYHIGNVDSPNGQYVFLPISSYSEQVVSLLEYIAKKDRKAKIALLVNPSPFGRAPVDDARKAAARLGLTIVDVQEVGAGNIDNTALLKRFEAAGIQYVVNQNTAGPVANVLKDAQRLGLLGKMQFMGAHYTGGEDLTRLAGSAAQGFIWATSFYLSDESTLPGIILVKKIGAQFGRGANTVQSIHYTAGMTAAAITVEAMKRAAAKGDVTNLTVYDALLTFNGTHAFDPGFTVSPVIFTKTDHVGAEGLRYLQADATGNFKAISGPFKSNLFRLVHPSQ